jgi:thioredoxin-related protein
MIKVIFLLTAFLSFGYLHLQAQETISWHTLGEAIELNRDEPRKFIVDVYTDWCGWCKRMDATTFSDEGIARYINKYFYAVKFDAEMKDSLTLGERTYYFVDQGRRGYHEVAAILTKGRLSYPTIVYLDEELRHIEVEPGYKTAEQLSEKLIYYHEERYKVRKNPIGM